MASIAAVLAALGIGLVLVVARREALVAGLALLVAAEVLLAQAGGSHLDHVTNKRIAMAVFGIVVLVALAVPFVRRPDLVAPAVVLFAPFRLPLHFGGSHFVSVAHGGALGRLLLLYLVLGAATAAFLWRTLREDGVRPLPREIAWPAAAFLAFASLSLLWSDASGNARSLLEFFLIPFALIVAVVGRADFPPRMPRILGSIVVGLALLFAVVGIVEEATRRLLFQSPAVEVGNAYSNFFRVTSLFRDPSLYGRHVVVGIAVLLVALWYRDVSPLVIAALVAVLFAGLFFSYSQSSFAALFAVTIFVSLVAGDRSVRVIVAVAAVLALVAGGALVINRAAHATTQRATSDRSRRLVLTGRVFAHHPLAGVGIGSQPRASQALSKEKGPPAFYVSHTTPLTVAAELGILGFAFYAALLAGTAFTIRRVWQLAPAFGLGLGAVFLALLVHSFFYTGFFDDPFAWLVPALAAAFLGRRDPEAA
jgi:hypothetical protein